MKRPEANLPSLAQPWGRWVEGELDSLSIAQRNIIESQASDANSFMSRMSNVGTSITEIASREIRLFELPDLTVSGTGSIGAPWLSALSAPYYFNVPPEKDGATATFTLSFESVNNLTGSSTVILIVNGAVAAYAEELWGSTPPLGSPPGYLISLGTSRPVNAGVNYFQVGIARAIYASSATLFMTGIKASVGVN